MQQDAVVQLRHWFWQFLDSRPDLTSSHIGAYTSLSKSGAESFLSKRSEFTKHIGSKAFDEFTKLRIQIEAGDLLQPESKSLALRGEVARRPRSKSRARGYYVTETSRRIAQVLDYCADQAAIGVVTADYGVGKSSAVQHWRSTAGLTIPNCYFEFDEFSRSSLRDFVLRLAEVVGVDCCGHRGSDTMRAIVRRLAAEPQLVILDQCETVTPRILQVIRQIWDGSHHAGTGVVLLSSPLLALRLQTARIKHEVGSLTSRVGIWAALDGIDSGSVAEILRQEGVKNIDDAAVNLLIRQARGSMRRLMAAADLLVTKHADKQIGERTIEQVAQHLWGMQIDPRRRAA